MEQKRRWVKLPYAWHVSNLRLIVTAAWLVAGHVLAPEYTVAVSTMRAAGGVALVESTHRTLIEVSVPACVHSPYAVPMELVAERLVEEGVPEQSALA